ncbi:KpsF/GutQ family sugar-phosphate isomerase [Thiobacillus sedimenti]|uniref:KpsF/GutQ family sugar-phosphate isomerase n=1 Tax=Thiobacillus sedimenti TaxID=3110231 RepID=A0ABZ1CKE1_9PROT|nr:KpsF/GutQ family sugar-phosphate isomerase [Thiobacillus sp. SCUT-2]WRS39857.1 KpsF/GutQ family sugar-phosphate isomerase [Thiobacillus sp. SCUT-2]
MRPQATSPEHLLALARQVLEIEADALHAISARLDAGFAEAVNLILACTGRVVVSGMGKSGHVGSKIAATLASTGTPAFFMHPGEASHGDLGMITHDDVVLALSNSGESSEIVSIVPLIKRRGAKLVAMTGNANSTMAREADVHLNAGVDKEACPLNLAPTASTTAALALGDALAVALLDARGFSADDFARTHPGGSLGRRLLIHVRDVMHGGDALPQVGLDATLKAALFEMTQKGLGMTAVVDAAGKVAGLFTDGDLRRALERPLDLQQSKIADLMTRNPKTIRADELAVAAVEKMESLKINGLLVVDENKLLVGALNMHDLLKAGVV